MEEKRCIICNKPYSYHYNMFGRGCLDNMYSLLGFSKPIGIFNKENYLCTKIAWRNHKFFLNKNKKRELAVFYSMQYVFLQVVVIGGMLTDKPLSAKLLSNSLTILGKEPEDLIIDDIKIINTMKENKTVKTKIKELIEKYGEKVGKVNINDYDNPDTLIRFAGGDFLYALHDATFFIKAERNKNDTWNIEIEINDTYDFTDFKDLTEYADNEESVLADIFSTLLNNFAVISSEYGVIKTYNVKISFDFNNYIIE